MLMCPTRCVRLPQVGNTPGVTKAVQEVHLDKQVGQNCDCLGILILFQC